MATQVQIEVQPVLEAMGFRFIPNRDGIIGGDMEYEVTHDVVKRLRQAHRHCERLVLTGEGSVLFRKEGDGAREAPRSPR